jgi:hypothetical protein
MANVVQLASHRPHRPRPDESLVAAIALSRWPSDSVYWLKEVAEVLSILEETGGSATPAMQSALAGPLATIEERITFFPQYYRFFLAIALSAQSLGMLPAGRAEALAQWVALQGWPDSELSDLNRAEARYLLRRAGWTRDEDEDLDRRLHRFMNRPDTFAIPNRKAAYELTHLVFYLSNHGRQDPQLSPTAIQSLRYAGTLAFLDQNADLLAEICLCLVYVDQGVPPQWLGLVEETAKLFALNAKTGMVELDDCHCLFVCNWLLGRFGLPAFQFRLPVLGHGQNLSVRGPLRSAVPLREMSVYLLGLGSARETDWTKMRAPIADALSPASRDIVWQAEQADDRFDEFFAAFARGQRAALG